MHKENVMANTVKWPITLGIGLVHLGVLAAPFTFTWPAFWTAFALYWITGGLGICLCYHRLLAHRSFQVPKPIEYLLTLIGCLALQGGPLKWVATHRLHHARSDQPDDPHSPKKGFWWAHMFWIFRHNPNIDEEEGYLRYVPDLAEDPVFRFLERWNVWPQVLLGLVLLAIGGWSLAVWGIFVRTVLVWHCTWLVNSAAHLWGYRRYLTGELSTNNWWVALLSYGEGWHNNHHAFLSSARHGLWWWEFDLTYWTIKGLSWLRIAKQIRLPSREQTLQRLQIQVTASQTPRPTDVPAIAPEPVASAV